MMFGFDAIGSLDAASMVALLAIAFVGMPHGAMDGAMAMHFGWMNNISDALKFLLSYISISILIVLIWQVIPVLSLILFLAISIWHFGRGDTLEDSSFAKMAVESISRGGLVIAGISQFHKSESNKIFEFLVEADTTYVWYFLDAAAIVTALSIVLSIVIIYELRRLMILFSELVLLSIIFFFAPPLLGFAIYFCLFHSLRHVKNMLPILKDTLSGFQISKLTIYLSIATWIIGIFAILQMSSTSNFEPVIIKIVFIGLAALTVPHMILVDGYLERYTQS